MDGLPRTMRRAVNFFSFCPLFVKGGGSYPVKCTVHVDDEEIPYFVANARGFNEGRVEGASLFADPFYFRFSC
jgi:hypothetical protein